MRNNVFYVVGVLLAGLLGMSACTSGGYAPAYTVEGVVSDSFANGRTIYITRYDDNKRLDSTVVRDNRFVFTGTVDTASLCLIDVTDDEVGNLILEAGNITVDLKNYSRASGTPLNDELARYSRSVDSLHQGVEGKYAEYQEQYKDPEELGKQWRIFMQEQQAKQRELGRALFAKHSDDPVGYYLLSSSFPNTMSPDEQKALFLSVGPNLKSTRFVQEQLAKFEGLENTAEGKPYVDVKGKDVEGKDVALSDFVGKGNYVLVDFWASWCGPCKGEIPNLAKLHKAYKDKGLTVVGIFVWDKEENFAKAVEDEGITWAQIFDTEDRAAALYGIDGIPQIMLIAPDGTIAKRNLRGEYMIKTVENTLKK